MKKLLGLILLTFCLSSIAADNAIKMGYNFTTVSQTVVFDSAMQAGGTLTFSAQATDGGGRSPGDPFTMKLVFYNSSNQVVNTVQTAFTLSLGAPLYNFTVTATNCGNSCAGVAYVSAQFYGKDGGYWAGNYGPMITSPSLKFNGGSNILYNSAFGVYGTNGFAQGWTSTAGWQNCALYAGAATCVINNGAPVNEGTYSATGGTTSAPAGGNVSAPPPPVYSSSITPAQQARVNDATIRLNAITKNSIYIDQVASNNIINVTQNTRNNQVDGVGSTYAPIQGILNNITIRQGDTGTRLGNNLLDLSVTGSGSNTLNLNQGTDTNGNWTGADIGKHYQAVGVAGYSNTVTTQQQNTGGGIGNYLEANIVGNYNTVGITQTGGAAQKQVFSAISGNNNTINATQTGTSGHYLDVGLSGNGNSAIVNQSNTGAIGANYATINLVNGGGPASVNLTQTGGQVYNILSTCVTVGGCQTITVRQGN